MTPGFRFDSRCGFAPAAGLFLGGAELLPRPSVPALQGHGQQLPGPMDGESEQLQGTDQAATVSRTMGR